MVAVRKGMYFCAALALAGSLFGADPFVGRWKLDLAKTTTTPQDPSAPQPREVTLIAKAQGDNREIVVQGLNADGSPIKGGFTIPIHGGPGKVADDNDSYDGITMKVVSPTVHDLIYTKGDRGVATRHVVLSPNG